MDPPHRPRDRLAVAELTGTDSCIDLIAGAHVDRVAVACPQPVGRGTPTPRQTAASSSQPTARPTARPTVSLPHRGRPPAPHLGRPQSQPRPASGQQADPARLADHERVALTFDMGGRVGDALAIVGWLVDHDVHATIFMTGAMADNQNTDAGREVLAIIDAHPGLFTLGNHSYTHRDFRTLSAAEIRDELRRTEAAIAPYCSQNPSRSSDRRTAAMTRMSWPPSAPPAIATP